jgi:queuine tRNA-ribosyltransferase
MLFTAQVQSTSRIKSGKPIFHRSIQKVPPLSITNTPKPICAICFAANEYLGKQIATIHNLGFYMWLVREARKHILAGDFREWKEMMVKQMSQRL